MAETVKQPNAHVTFDEKDKHGIMTDASNPHNPGDEPPMPDGTPTGTPKDRYQHFKNVIGIVDDKKVQSFYKRVNDAYFYHSLQYWFIASLINTLLFTQIVVGAVLTGLGSSDKPAMRRAIVWLGATNTVIAAVLAYFKSRNQPNRVRQFRSGLQKVREAIGDVEADIRGAQDRGHYDDESKSGKTKEELAQQVRMDVEEKVQLLRKMYYDARNDAESNYPDLWVKYGDSLDKAMLKTLGNSNVVLPAAGYTGLKPPTQTQFGIITADEIKRLQSGSAGGAGSGGAGGGGTGAGGQAETNNKAAHD